MTYTITFNELRKIKDMLPHGSMQRIAEDLGISTDTVRNYFGADNYDNGGSSAGIHVEQGPPLGDYRLVILGTPVWAGRSSAVMRSFLKDRGGEIRNAAYVLTRSSGSQYQEVYRQMDLCVPAGHLAAVSLRSGDVGWAFWQEEFLRQVRAFLEGQ